VGAKGQIVTAKTVWGAAFLALSAYEVYTLLNRDKSDTLSEVVWATLDTAAPVVPFLAGVVVGHWVWPRKITN
jgi:hypothetical protein